MNENAWFWMEFCRKIMKYQRFCVIFWFFSSTGGVLNLEGKGFRRGNAEDLLDGELNVALGALGRVLDGDNLTIEIQKMDVWNCFSTQNICLQCKFDAKFNLNFCSISFSNLTVDVDDGFAHEILGKNGHLLAHDKTLVEKTNRLKNYDFGTKIWICSWYLCDFSSFHCTNFWKIINFQLMVVNPS